MPKTITFNHKRKLLIFLIIVTIIAALIRFHELSYRQYWMIDEERDAFIVKKILIDKHPTLIGGALPGGFYLAPGYFYISAIFYYLSDLNPIGLGRVAAIISVISIPILFIITRAMFNSKVAVLAALFYTFSYLTVIYNRTWWPLTFSPLVSIISYFSLFQIVRTKNLKWFIPLTLALIVGVQSDPSNFSILLTSIIVILFFKIPLKNFSVALAIFLFIVSHIPLLIFDLRHDFLNSKAILRFFSGQSGSGINFDPHILWDTLLLLPRNAVRFFWVFGDKDVAYQIHPSDVFINAKYSAIPGYMLFVAAAILLIFLISSFRVSKKNPAAFIISLHILISILGISLHNFFFGSWTYEWILQILFPAYAIGFSVIILNLVKRFKILSYPFVLIVIIYLVFSWKTIITSPNSYNLQDKLNAVRFAASKLNNEDFSLDSIGKNFSWGGYRYLFYAVGHEPVKSYTDPAFADWLYPKSSAQQPDKVVVIVNHENLNDQKFNNQYQQYLAKTYQKEKFGRIEVLIVDNSDKWIKW